MHPSYGSVATDAPSPGVRKMISEIFGTLTFCETEAAAQAVSRSALDFFSAIDQRRSNGHRTALSEMKNREERRPSPSPGIKLGSADRSPKALSTRRKNQSHLTLGQGLLMFGMLATRRYIRHMTTNHFSAHCNRTNRPGVVATIIV